MKTVIPQLAAGWLQQNAEYKYFSSFKDKKQTKSPLFYWKWMCPSTTFPFNAKYERAADLRSNFCGPLSQYRVSRAPTINSQQEEQQQQQKQNYDDWCSCFVVSINGNYSFLLDL